MSKDLIAALRDYNRHDTDELMDKAADEIDRLRATLKGAEAGRDSSINELYNAKAEIDRLRAENTELMGGNCTYRRA